MNIFKENSFIAGSFEIGQLSNWKEYKGFWGQIVLVVLW